MPMSNGRLIVIGVAVCFLLTFFNITKYNLTDNSPTKSHNINSLHHEYITLCNQKIYLHIMPYAKPNLGEASPYGIRQWKQNQHHIHQHQQHPHEQLTSTLPQKSILVDYRTKAEGITLYGRTGNQIQEFFHAFDMARDRGGDMVMRKHGFPMDTTLKEIFLGMDDAADGSSTTTTRLEERFGITFYENLNEKERTNLTLVGTEPLFHYISNDPRFDLDDVMLHRRYVIQELYRITAEYMKMNPNSEGVLSMCSSLHALFGKGDATTTVTRGNELGMKNVTQRYAVIHSRSLEGFGPKFMQRAHEIFGVDAKVGREYPATLLTHILNSSGLWNAGVPSPSILMITDGDTPKVIQDLSSHPIIGPNFQVLPNSISTVSGDMMLAIMADVFVGNPVSTFSQYIVQARYAIGKGNSYLFARRKSGGDGDDHVGTDGSGDYGEEQWETFCSSDERCFYEWQKLWITQF